LRYGRGVCFSGQNFVAVGRGFSGSITLAAISSDGSSWTPTGPGLFVEANGVAASPTHVVAVGTAISSGPRHSIAYSSDHGQTWTGSFGLCSVFCVLSLIVAATGIGNSIFVSQGLGVAYSASLNRFVAVGSGKFAYSDTGTSFVDLGRYLT